MSDPYTKALAMIEELRAEYDKIARKHARLVEALVDYRCRLNRIVMDIDALLREVIEHARHDTASELLAQPSDDPETPKGEEKRG